MIRKRIIVIDGQGGGFGTSIIRELKKVFGEFFEIIALGTNSISTASMLEAGANKGATGENAIIHNVNTADYILGSISIVIANSMLGELTEKMANAISNSKSRKILIPITQEPVTITGLKREPLPHHISEMIMIIKNLEGKQNV